MSHHDTLTPHRTRHPLPWGRLLDTAGLLLTGGATSRSRAKELDLRLRRALPLACRALIIPTAPQVGASNTAIQLAALLTRTRGLPGLLLDASEHPQDPQTLAWSPPPAGRAPASAAQAHEIAGITPDTPLGRLRLAPWRDVCPPQWDSIRSLLMRFHDTVLTETAPMRDAHILAAAHHAHCVILVTRATRADVEATRERIATLTTALSHAPRPPRLLHAVVATRPGPALIPRLNEGEVLIPFDPVLARTTATRTAAPGLIQRPTGMALAHLAAGVLDAAGPQEAS